PEEVVALLAGVLAAGLDQLGAEGGFDVGEPVMVVAGEVHHELVGHDSIAFDVDGAVVVHLADEPAAELDRANGVAGTPEHALDHTLQAAFESLHTHSVRQGTGRSPPLNLAPWMRVRVPNLG